MKEQKKETLFEDFIHTFPEVELPILISDEAISDFSRHNKPLSQEMIRAYIEPYEFEEQGEYTEYIACCKLKDIKKIHTIIYWKAALLTYQYYLVTYDPSGLQLAKHKIAGVVMHGEKITQAVAKIEKDWIVYVAQGSEYFTEKSSDLLDNRLFSLEILADGQIIFT